MTHANRRVLLIAYHYPPVSGSSGVQRTLQYSVYLREFGWEPLVLTITPNAYESTSPDQLATIPEGVVVERAFGLDTARHLAIGGRYLSWTAQPDRWVTWFPAAVMRGLAMVRRWRPDVIMSTYPIASAHMVGLALARLTRLPWIADFRDSMTEPGYPRDELTWRTNRRLEAAIVKRSACSVFTTSGTLDMYASRYPEVTSDRWAIIENGFDEPSFQSAQMDCPRDRIGPPGQLTLLHSGILYPEERDPRPFFAALRALVSTGAINETTLKVVLRATGSDATYADLLRSYGLEAIVELAPPIGYNAALQEMLRADGLLLFQAAMCNHQIPAKLYEYFRAGRPIFALTDPTGNTAETLRANGATHIVEITSPNDIQRGLTDFLALLRTGNASGVSKDAAAKHSRRSRTEELSVVLNGSIGSRHNRVTS